MEIVRYYPKHRFGEVKTDDVCSWIAIFDRPGKPAFAAPNVRHALAAQIAKESQNQLDVIDPRIDPRGKMLFIRGGFLETAAYLTE
jgi:hypothetical protein